MSASVLAADAKSKSGAVVEKEPESLIEPFTPPPLSELDKTAEWIDQPVVDFMSRLAEEQAKSKPLTGVAEALKLKNDSSAANAKILSALGRLPADPKVVNWEATINRHTAGDVKSTNPIMISSVTEFDVAGLTGFGLFGNDWNLQMAASSDSVRDWKSSKDRLKDKIVLRDDLTWSDGHPITAHDIVYTWRLIMNPRVPVPAVRSGTDKLRWIEAYDDHTLVFFHKEALATNVENISFPILPKHIYEKTAPEDPSLSHSPEHVKLESAPVTGGPYEFRSRISGQEIVVERRESYYMHGGKQVRDKPYFKTVRIRVMEDTNTALLALKKGEIDEMILTPSQWTSRTNDADFYARNTKATGLEWVYFYFGWNLKQPFFTDVRVREAMGYAFNHEKLLKNLCYGLYEPANGIFYHSAWMAPKKALPYYKHDPDKAEDLLDAAGWTDHDNDGVRDKVIDGKLRKFEFTMLCANIADRIEVCKLLQQNLDEIGVKMNVRPLEFATFQQKTHDKDFEAMHAGWGAGSDPDSSENIWKTGEPRNYVSFSNPEVDKLYEAGRHEFDRAKRAAIYAKIDELIYAEQPYTFLYFRNSFYGFDKHLRGYKFSPRGPFNYSPGFSSIWMAE